MGREELESQQDRGQKCPHMITTAVLLSDLLIFLFEVRGCYKGPSAQKANIFKDECIMGESILKKGGKPRNMSLFSQTNRLVNKY